MIEELVESMSRRLEELDKLPRTEEVLQEMIQLELAISEIMSDL